MPISAVFAYIDVTPQMYRDKMPTSSKNRHPKLIGDSSAAHILARLVDHFVGVYIPWGENTRADFIVDDGERLLRIQAKTGRLREGAIRFPTCSSYYHHPAVVQGRKYGGHKGYAGEADLFAVYCADIDAVYLVPVSEVGERRGALRIDPSRNNQKKKIRWAENYELRPGRPSSAPAATLFVIDHRRGEVREAPARYSVA